MVKPTKFYLLSRKGKIDWDEFNGFVVGARSPREARQFAANEDDRYEDAWLDPEFASCRELHNSRTPGVILSSFIAG